MNRKETCYNKYGGRCAYCGTKISINKMHIDHMKPLNRGANSGWKEIHAGKDEENNRMPSCASCNNRKRNLSLDKFRSEISAQIMRLRRGSGAFRIAERYGLIKVKENPVLFYFENHI